MKAHPEAILPSRGTPQSGGLDLYADETVVIYPHQTMRVPTGIHVALPAGTVGFIKPRSSSFFAGLDLDGTIDSDYRGPLLMQIRNTTAFPVSIDKGKRYAQLVVMSYIPWDVVECATLDDTTRGEGGFGSTGM
jgi:dUTP pyrophosphatase